MRTKPENIKWCLALMVTLALPLVGHATVLFQDTFDRPDNLNISTDSTGMSGTAAPMTYKEVEVAPEHTQVTNSALYMAFGPNASVVGLESHNFIDSDILTDGGFSISMDLENLGPQTGNDFFCGFGVGISSNEMANLALDYNSSAGPRGRMGSGFTGVADFFTCFTANLGGDVQIFFQAVPTGTQIDVNAGDLIGSSGTLRADFYPDGFGLGENVTVYVYFNDNLVVRTNFTWTDANENYLAVDARQTDGYIVDNLLVETIVKVPIVAGFAADPSIIDLSSSSNLVTLQWTADFMSGGATYAVSADKAVTYPSGNTGSAVDGVSQVSAIVDGTLDDVEFTLVVNTGGTLLTNTATVIAVPPAPALQSTLFADNYNRAYEPGDWNDIDFSSVGMGGTLAPVVYLETCERHNISTTNWDDTSTLINIDISGLEEVCSMANGDGMSIWGLDHNFTDSSILTDGGFSVALDIVEINSVTGDAGDRYSGFGVGLTLAEINAFDDENGGDLQGPRGAVEGGTRHSGMADFFTSLSIDNQLQVFADGVLIGQFPLTTNAGRLRADFGVTDFNAGSFVAYQVYFDGLLRSEGFFQWQQDNQNYIAVSSRGTGYVDVDNLEIGTVNVPFTAPATHPDVVAQVTGLTPATPPFSSIGVGFNSVAGVTYRADISESLTNAFAVAPGPVGGEAVFAATNSTTSATVDLPGGFEDSGFLQISPVRWPGPIVR